MAILAQSMRLSLVCLLLASFLFVGCDESRLEEDEQLISEISARIMNVIAPDSIWIERDAGLFQCGFGFYMTSSQASATHAIQINMPGHDIAIDQYLAVAWAWLPENGWANVKDTTFENGRRVLRAINHDTKVHLYLDGDEKAFSLFLDGPCRTVINWPD